MEKKKLFKMSCYRSINFRIRGDFYAKFKKIAALRQTNMSAMLKGFVIQTVKDYEAENGKLEVTDEEMYIEIKD